MTVQELIDCLKELAPDTEVMILDGYNGGGIPRTINIGPFTREISASDDRDSYDCEGRKGEVVAVMGYGCY